MADINDLVILNLNRNVSGKNSDRIIDEFKTGYLNDTYRKYFAYMGLGEDGEGFDDLEKVKAGLNEAIQKMLKDTADVQNTLDQVKNDELIVDEDGKTHPNSGDESNTEEDPTDENGDSEDELTDQAEQYIQELEAQLDDRRQAVKDESNIENIAKLVQFYQTKVKGSTDQKLKDNFAFVADLQERLPRIEGSENCTSNVVVRQDKNGAQYLDMAVKNFGGHGLNFTINSDRSIILTDQQTMQPEQVGDLVKFFKENGLTEESGFNFDSIKNIKVQSADGDRDFKDVFKEKLTEEKPEDKPMTDNELESWLQDQGVSPKDPDLANKLDGLSFKDTKLSMFNFKDKVKVRMNIMGFTDNRLITTRRCLDGSIVICCYTNDSDKRHDDETSKGDVKRTKAFAVKLKYKNGHPVVGWYLPQGKVLETPQMQCMLEAIRSQDCDYFYAPSALLTAGKGQGAMWEAIGKTLVCPITKNAKYTDAKEKGVSLGGDNVHDILESLKKESTKHGREKVIKFKKQLLDQLNAQEEYAHAQADAKKEKYDTPSGLAAEIAGIRATVNYDNFNNGELPQLLKFIEKQAPFDPNVGAPQWNAVDVSAAYLAMTKICREYPALKDINDGKELTMAQLMGRLSLHMNGGEDPYRIDDKGKRSDDAVKHKGTREEIVAQFNYAVTLEKGTPDKATNHIRKYASEKVKAFREDIKENYSYEFSAFTTTGLNTMVTPRDKALKDDKTYNRSLKKQAKLDLPPNKPEKSR